jgi:hypothetical protein
MPIGHVDLAVREGEHDIEDPADAVQTRRAGFDGAQPAAAAVRLCRRGIESTLQHCCSADSRGASERLWRPALRPFARLFGVTHHGRNYLRSGRIINTNHTSE